MRVVSITFNAKRGTAALPGVPDYDLSAEGKGTSIRIHLTHYEALWYGIALIAKALFWPGNIRLPDRDEGLPTEHERRADE